MNVLVENLCSLGFHHFAIPVSTSMIILADVVVENRGLVSLMHMQAAELYQKLQMVAAYNHHWKAADGVYLTEQDQVR